MSSSKVKCTCGWSWNKSDSSKKDMYICHECGRDNSNNMKNGGWLDNYNDSEVSLPEGYVGEGYDTSGRDYSPAWGGQFQGGGKLTFLQPTSEKLPQGYRIPYADPSSELAMSIGGENGEPAYLIPSFKYGRPLENPMEEFKKTGEHLGGPFKTWQEADQWEQEVRHPYVEKGQAIPMPIKTWGEMAMGGSIPGSVGFTYARTNSPAPSNGKYAKKTMASAQNGEKVFNKKVIESTSTSKDRIPVSSKNIIKTLPGTNVHVNNKGEVVVKDEKGVYKPYKSQQSEIKQGKKKSAKEYKKEQEIIKEMQSDNLGLRAPLHYLANPDHMLGDLGNFTGFKPLQQFSNSDEDARRYNFQALDPSKSKDERLSNNFNEALNLLPKAGVNLTLGRLASKTPIGGLIEAYNPIPLPYSLGMKIDPTDFWKGVENNSDSAGLIHSQNIFPIRTSISPELRQGLRTNGLTFNGTPRKYPINNSQRAVTEDVDRLFEEFPELTKIGSKEDYIKHLETIHPETTQPGIFYRGSKNPNLNVSEWTPNPNGGNNLGQGFYFTPDPFKAEKYGKETKALLNIKDPTYTSLRLNTNGFIVPDGMMTKDLVEEGSGILSVQNPNRDLFTEMGSRAEGYMHKYKGPLDEQGFPVATRPYTSSPHYIEYSQIDEVAVPNNSQIHVLGSDADKELFKNYLNNNKKRDGGIIKDDRGQWDHPGEITEIGSNQITMQGVPYPVLGVSDEGDVQMMYPEEEYKFKGKKVTEFPMAKNGIRQEQKGLVNLDQLTNFTNYNTKQPGGWMDKYQ